MKITVFDYGAGNLHSLVKAVSRDDTTVRIEADPDRALDGDVLILPGVGAFAPAAAALEPARETVANALRQGHPCVGICLGMQLMFERSDEGAGNGLGLFSGPVTPVRAQRTPHIGWNTVEDATDSLFASSGMSVAYYANGYVARPADVGDVIAWSTHEQDRFPAAVRRGAVIGVQFHPEKSSTSGVHFLHAALDEVTS